MEGSRRSCRRPQVQLTYRRLLRQQGRALESHVFDGIGRFAALAGEWNALADAAPRHRLFLTHDWFDSGLAWQRTGKPWFFVLREGERLAGAAALSLARDAHHRIPVRKLRFLTVPDTQFCDLLAHGHDEETMVDAFATWLADTPSEWDVLELDYLAADSVAAKKLPPALERMGISTQFAVVDRNPLVQLEGGWERFVKAKSRSVKKAINLASNRLARTGRVEIAHVAGSDADSAAVDAMLSAAVSVSSRSWKRPLGVSLDCPGPHDFVTRLTRHAHTRGWLSIWILRVDGNPVAMEYQLADRGCVYALRSDYDERFAGVSPGAHLNRELLEQLFARGGGRYYMGPGTNAYKWRWTQDYEPVACLTAYSPNVRGQLARFVDRRIVPRLASIRAWRQKSGTPPLEES